MKVLVKAFNLRKISSEAEGKIGLVMRRIVRAEGHEPKLPKLPPVGKAV